MLGATGIEAEAHLPYAGLHHLLRPVLSDVDRLPATQAGALSTTFGMSDGPPPEPFMIALATLNLLTDVAAERPVLLVAATCSGSTSPPRPSSRSWPAGEQRSVRTDRRRAQGHDIAFATAGLPELDLRGLDQKSARDVLAQQAAGLSYADTERILREAAGNPLALVELPLAVRAAADAGMETLPQALPLTARLERASPHGSSACRG